MKGYQLHWIAGYIDFLRGESDDVIMTKQKLSKNDMIRMHSMHSDFAKGVSYSGIVKRYARKDKYSVVTMYDIYHQYVADGVLPQPPREEPQRKYVFALKMILAGEDLGNVSPNDIDAANRFLETADRDMIHAQRAKMLGISTCGVKSMLLVYEAYRLNSAISANSHPELAEMYY